MMMLRKMMIRRDVLNLNLVDLLRLMVDLGLLLLLLRLLLLRLRLLLLLRYGRVGGVLRLLLLLLRLMLMLEHEVMLRRGLNGFGLTGLRRELFSWADVPRASFTERDEPDFDVGVYLRDVKTWLAHNSSGRKPSARHTSNEGNGQDPTCMNRL